jgi:hypothetical protein
LGELIAAVGVCGGGRSRVPAGFRRGGWRMFRFEIDLMISRFLLAIAVADVDDRLRSSFRLGFQTFNRLT